MMRPHSAFTTALTARIFAPTALSTASRWVPENSHTLTPAAAGGEIHGPLGRFWSSIMTGV